MRNICVVGTGYVGLVSGACFAELGNRVWCVDTDEAKVASLREGVLPIYEPGLDDMVHRNMASRRLVVTTSFQEGLEEADFAMVTVGTPNTPEGEVDLSYIRSTYKMIVTSLNGRRPIIVNKSTVPPGTGEAMEKMLARLANGAEPLPIVSNPEFLSEGSAVNDFMRPSRVVVGSGDPKAAEEVADLHRALDCPILVTDTRSAEMIKYASNAFLATKISFINEIAAICDGTGVDVTQVAAGIGMDPRIGGAFLNAGIGYGGSCLPKDMAVLTNVAREAGVQPDLLDAAISVNSRGPARIVSQVAESIGDLHEARVAVLGLTFKPGTDDLRFSSAIQIVERLLEGGAHVRACDPQACRNVRRLPGGAEYVMNPYQAAEGCNVVILATEWPEYATLDLGRLREVMAGNLMADGRNVIDPRDAEAAGFDYIGVGRGNGPVRSSECDEASAHLD